MNLVLGFQRLCKLQLCKTMLSYHLKLFICATFINLAPMISAGEKGDQADLIIKQIMTDYEKTAHPNSKRADGAVVAQIGVSPLSISIVRYRITSNNSRPLIIPA